MRANLNTTVDKELLEAVRRKYKNVPMSQLLDMFFRSVLNEPAKKPDNRKLKAMCGMQAALGLSPRKTATLFATMCDDPIYALQQMNGLAVEVLSKNLIRVGFVDRTVYHQVYAQTHSLKKARYASWRAKEIEIEPGEDLVDVCCKILDIKQMKSGEEVRFLELMKQLEEQNEQNS